MDEDVLPSVWAKAEKEQQAALTTRQIVRAAIELLDAEGIEQLSMRRLGSKLNAGATSLYRHVKNKDQLLELVVDEVYGEVEVPKLVNGDWRTVAETTAHSLRAMILRHPWVGGVLGQTGLTALGPNVLTLSEQILSALKQVGFTPVEADQAMNTVLAYVIGIAVSETAYLSMIARAGSVEQTFARLLFNTAKHIVKSYPVLHEGYAATEHRDPAELRDENFDYGLQRVLDGLEVRLKTIGSGR